MELDENLKAKVAAYSPSAKALDPIREVPLLFMVGITGAGKNTVLNRLLQRHSDRYHFLRSHTTRAPRANDGVMEQDGREYHFVDYAAIDSMLEAGDFIEVQRVHSQVYGSSVSEVLLSQEEHKVGVNDIDIQGADYCVGLGLNVKPVFILPPNYEIWFERFNARYGGRVHKHDLAVRMQSAVKEIEHALAVDYFYIVINDNLDETVELVDEIGRGDAVPPHYHKAVAIAEQLLERIRAELKHMI